MGDDDEMRPRRAWQEEISAPSPPEPDPTPADEIFRPRRGASPQPDPVTPIPPPVFPRSAGDHSDESGPAPRRSAMSSQTPPGPDHGPAPARDVDRRAIGSSLAKWAVGGLVGAVAVGSIAFVVARGDGEPATPAGPSASPSVSASPSAPAVTTASLVTGEDLSAFASAEAWAVTATSEAVADHEGRVACLSTENPVQNPTTSLQRTLATSADDQLAALHRIDVYASEAAAEQMFSARTAALSSCDEVPARIVSASDVTGLGDRAFQLTVAFENQPTLFHTVLMTRVGSAVQTLDVARTGSPVDSQEPAGALARPQTELCDAEGVACTVEPEVSGAVVPLVEPAGWLIPSDLPRIRPGSGRWTASDPTDLTSQGMGCENMTLATEPGPTRREQATYLMTQDDRAPATFGMDELMFKFRNAEDADAFVKKLGLAIAQCGDRVNTAKVNELSKVDGTGADGTEVNTRLFSVKQATTDEDEVPYQLILSVAGDKVVYSIVTVTDDYRFTEAQLKDVGLRVGVRASQG